ncbi:MAG TPA: cytochrome c [Candidatus Acidoferrales bacterium]|nr:cytochrome c [Candidatus Acidoferrales bacterium]
MIARRSMLFLALLLAASTLLLARTAAGQEEASATNPPPAASARVQHEDDEAARAEGERRFHANCGRCHQAPHKFPPRMMATIVRHMRVRATITDEDMKLILRYMTQ